MLIVQSKTATGATATLAAGTTGGNCLVVGITDIGTISTPSVTAVTLGGAAGNFSSLVNAVNAAGHMISNIWADPNCAAGQTAIAITESNSHFPVTVSYEIAGVASSAVLDKSSTGGSSSTNWSSGATATTTQPVEAWIGLTCINNTAPTGPGAPWSNLSQTNVSNFTIGGEQLTSATGAAQYAGTIVSATNWVSAVVTLLPSPAITASGSVALAPMRLGGTGKETFAASGSVALAPMRLGGTGKETFAASGSVALAPMALGGSGGVTGNITGTGSVAFAPMRLHGTATETGSNITGTGSVALALMRIQGTGASPPGSGGGITVWQFPRKRRRTRMVRRGWM